MCVGVGGGRGETRYYEQQRGEKVRQGAVSWLGREERETDVGRREAEMETLRKGEVPGGR